MMRLVFLRPARTGTSSTPDHSLALGRPNPCSSSPPPQSSPSTTPFVARPLAGTMPDRPSSRQNPKEAGLSKSFKRKQQKFERKLSFYSKVKDAVTFLHAQKDIKKKKHRSRKKKLKAYDLSSLSEFLPNLDTIKPPPDASSWKLKKQELVEKEGRHLKAVLSHPVFQSDPLSAIHQHILNTQLPSQDKPKSKEGKTRGKSWKKGRKVASSGTHSMDAFF